MSTKNQSPGGNTGPGTTDVAGTTAAAFSFLIWGILPLYWKALRNIPSLDILMHRILWSFVLSGLLIALGLGRASARAALRSKPDMLIMVYRALLLGVNWYIYIWAVTKGYILDASLGYYINPLFNVALGVIILHERLDRMQAAAFIIASAGVAYMTVRAGIFPWISIALSLTFGLYGLSKKRSQVDSLAAIAIEMGILMPIAVSFLIVQAVRGVSSFSTASAGTITLLVCAGIVTVVPLLLFSTGAKRIPLTWLGFLQYIAPTGMLVIGILSDGREFTLDRAITFGCIWTALLLYSVSLKKRKKRL